MRNLGYFCHYHRGDHHERAVKIVGSFLIVGMLAATSVSFTDAVYAQQEGAIMAPLPGERPSMPFPKPPGPPGPMGGGEGRMGPPPGPGGDFRGPMMGNDDPSFQPRSEMVRPGLKPMPPQKGERKGPPSEKDFESGEKTSGNESKFPDPSTEEEGEEGEQDSRDTVDQKELQQVTRQFQDMKRELNRFGKTKGIAQTDKDAIAELLKKIDDFAAALKSSPSRETLQEFYEENIWEKIQELRGRLELPKELKMIERELAKTKKLVAIKTFQKAFTVVGFDVEVVKVHLAEIETALAEAKSNYEQGNYQDAFEALEPIHQGMHPGAIQGIMQRLRDVGNQIGRIRDAQVRELFIELLQPIVEAAKEGDYDGAHQIMNEIEPQLRKLMNQATKVRAKDIGSLQSKFDSLEELIGKKVDARDEASGGSSGQ